MPGRVSTRSGTKWPELADPRSPVIVISAICAAITAPSRDTLAEPRSCSGFSRRSTRNSSPLISTVTR